MENLKIFSPLMFFDHLTGVGAIVLYVILSASVQSQRSASSAGHGNSLRDPVPRVGPFFNLSGYEEPGSSAHYLHAATILNLSQARNWS
jgi:hypothetical protein